MAEDSNIENQTLDKIEHPKEAPKPKKKRSFKLNMDLIIALLLTLTTTALIVWWYLEVSKVN